MILQIILICTGYHIKWKGGYYYRVGLGINTNNFARLFMAVLNKNTWREKRNKDSINVWWIWSSLTEIQRLGQLRN